MPLFSFLLDIKLRRNMSKIPQPMSPKQEMMLNSKAKITIIGGAAGSGKSYIMTMHPLQYVHDPNFNAIFFRRNTTQVTGQGGLYDTAKSIYNELPVSMKPRFREKDLKAMFPSGANVKWNHMEHENDRFSFQGLQFSGIYFDEGKLPH